jgi:hypothetical protein
MTRILGLAVLAVFVVSQVVDAGLTASLVAAYGQGAETNPYALQTLASQGLGTLLLLKAGFTVFLVVFCSTVWLAIGHLAKNGGRKVRWVAGTGRLLLLGFVLFEAWEVGFKETWPWLAYGLGFW